MGMKAPPHSHAKLHLKQKRETIRHCLRPTNAVMLPGRKQERPFRHRRHDFAHKLSRRLVNEFGIVAFEDLQVQNMLKNGHLAKSIADAAWSQLVQYTTYKAESAGRRVYTTKSSTCCLF
jgi:putative transposase